MVHGTGTERLESIRSFQSTIRKLEKALVQMREKGANTTVVEKRLRSQLVGLAILEYTWEGNPHPYPAEDLVEARNIMAGLLPSLKDMYMKMKEGSPQRTILKRRIRSLELAIQAIDHAAKG